MTRGELFFARGIIFVEGDAERFLIPAYANALGIDLDALGVTVCSVASANFLPYVKLVEPNALNIPFVVITDLDPTESGTPLAESRVRNIMGVWLDERTFADKVNALLKQAELVGIFVNERTLEVELFKAGMGPAMAKVLSKHANTWGVKRQGWMQGWIDDPTTLDEDKLLGWVEEVSKGRFAQALAGHVEAALCPDYIKRTLEYVKNGFTSL